MQNEFFKFSTDSDSPSEAEPLCAFSSKLVKKDKVMGIFVENNLNEPKILKSFKNFSQFFYKF